MCVMLAAVVVGGTTLAGDPAEAGNDRRKGSKHRYERDRDWDRHGDRDRDDRRGDRYFVEREVHVIREYYRPHYRALPRGVRHHYYRTGRLPRGWERRMRPIPVYVERELVVLPREYHRGIIDGHAVVYNSRGVILDIAVLF